jgi:hypothetical protein
MTDEAQDLDVVRRRLEEIQNRKRGDVRWNVSRHTAELAIVAIEKETKKTTETGARQAPRSPKARRRKRNKRML